MHTSRNAAEGEGNLAPVKGIPQQGSRPETQGQSKLGGCAEANAPAENIIAAGLNPFKDAPVETLKHADAGAIA